MALPPIRSQIEIDAVLNRAQHAIADLGYEIVGDVNRGGQPSDEELSDKILKLILLCAYLENLLDSTTGELELFWTDPNNEKKLNGELDAVVRLSGIFNGPVIPLIVGGRAPLQFYPSTSGPASGGQSNSGGPATPGGVTFQNLNISSPGEIVDSLDANGNEYAYYILFVKGTNPGEGARIDIAAVAWSAGNQPKTAVYRGDSIGGSTTGVEFTAAIVDGMMELTCEVPTDGWRVKGTRISFENISFQNVLGPLPVGGTLGQFLKKTSSVDFECEWSNIAISDISGLNTQLVNLTNLISTAQAAADAAQADIDTHAARTDNPHSVTKAQVGLANADNTADAVKVVKTATDNVLKAGDTMSGNLNMGGNKVTNLADPTSAQEAATKAYVDGGLVQISADTYVFLLANIKKVHNWDYNSSARTGTLPAASTVPAGVSFTVKDSAYIAETYNITMGLTGGDTFEDGSTTFVFDVNGEAYDFYSDGVSKWFIK